MADSLIQRLKRAIERETKIVRRAGHRRHQALRAHDKAGAVSALRVQRRHRKIRNRFVRRLRHRRRVLSVKRWKRHGLVWYDGHQIAAWIAPELDRARRHGWHGYVVSGYRSPAYSKSLCYRMCGQPACPGRCAGRASNHSGIEYPRGAVDVTDFWRLQALSHSLGLRVHNGLPRTDPVHFSNSGA